MNPEAAVERAFALLDLQRPRDALEHLRGAVAEAPDVPELHCLIALAQLQLGDAKGALAAANRAVAAGPGEEWGHRLRAVALIQLGRKGEGRDAALAAARLAPDEATTHIVLASALQATGDQAGAEAAARRAVELDPEDADTHSTLGEVLFEQGRPGEAIPAYTAALAINPENPDVINNLAVARLRVHDRRGTGEQFEAAARLDPRHDIARHNILHTGPAGRSFVYRRFAVGFALLALPVALGSLLGGLVILAITAAFEALRAVEVRRLSGPARQMLADDRRARRLRPLRWDAGWPTRLRPWWWILLTRLPPPLIVTFNLFFLAAAIASAQPIWVLALGIALPFSLMRLWRWFRHRHPGRAPGALPS